MSKQEKKQLFLFLEELKKYEFLDGATALMLLNKFIRPLRKRFFNENLKLKYYSYWFKIACKSGILENKGLGYKVLTYQKDEKI
jgi:hypothetical protein